MERMKAPPIVGVLAAPDCGNVSSRIDMDGTFKSIAPAAGRTLPCAKAEAAVTIIKPKQKTRLFMEEGDFKNSDLLPQLEENH